MASLFDRMMMGQPARMEMREYRDLPLWTGLSEDDRPGNRYRAEFVGVPYLVTIKSVNGQLQSGSQRVEFMSQAVLKP